MGLENNIPEGWVESTIGKVTVVESGGTPSTKNSSYWGDEIPWITPRDLSSFKDVFIEKGERSISIEGLENSSAKLLPKNTILFSSRAPIGYVVIAQNEAATNQGFKNLICDEVNSHFKYFYYLMKYKADFIERLSSGSTFSEASGTLIKSIELYLPPLPEQKAIAKVLTAFDDKIELLQAQNKTLETMAQTIFKEWFGKYQIGDELPEGWKEGKLGYLDFITFGDGNYSSKYPKQSEFIDDGIPFISNKDIKNGIIQPNGLRYISPELHSTLTKGHLEKWDIIMSTRANIGDIALVSSAFSGANINAQLIFIRSTRKEFYTPYLLQLFSSKLFRETVENYSSGSAQSQLPMHALREIPILIPDEKTLLKFAQLWNKLTSKKEINQNQIQSLTKTRDTLLPKLMSGQVRVNNINEESNIVSGDLIENAEGSIPDNIIDDGPKINLF